MYEPFVLIILFVIAFSATGVTVVLMVWGDD
ncbi:hypothetical protein M2401_000864 [Pseudomonas sp. JUb42]|nr:hypothetical protein [Pseudomonas sp. JUb42]